MEFKGTPAPWFVHPTSAAGSYGLPIFYEVGNEETYYSQKFINCLPNEYIAISNEQAKANAQLISCAPEMLDALIDLKQTIEFLASKGYTNENSAAMQRAKDIIKRATTI
ncbi:hypothetical protein [Niabella aurantiaca]|uniref:hypothetical protein n=1 Tax=Niabella aurantiaca TaxID=379900 RepID=UPI00037954B3|nr:hypothetical protein [Niabella aurantiaca]